MGIIRSHTTPLSSTKASDIGLLNRSLLNLRANLLYPRGALVTQTSNQSVGSMGSPNVLTWFGVSYQRPQGIYDGFSPTLLTVPEGAKLAEFGAAAYLDGGANEMILEIQTLSTSPVYSGMRFAQDYILGPDGSSSCRGLVVSTGAIPVFPGDSWRVRVGSQGSHETEFVFSYFYMEILDMEV